VHLIAHTALTAQGGRDAWSSPGSRSSASMLQPDTSYLVADPALTAPDGEEFRSSPGSKIVSLHSDAAWYLTSCYGPSSHSVESALNTAIASDVEGTRRQEEFADSKMSFNDMAVT
jgi:hypothetical protein